MNEKERESKIYTINICFTVIKMRAKKKGGKNMNTNVKNMSILWNTLMKHIDSQFLSKEKLEW